MNDNGWLQDEHPKRLGKLIGNLQSIEGFARIFLAVKKYGSLKETRPVISTLKEGHFTEESPISDGRSLKPVLESYNECVKTHSQQDLTVNIDEIVKLRDALAHGRVFGTGPLENGPLRLLKFAKHSANDKVKVELCEDMTEKWFREKIELLEQATENIRKALGWQKSDIK